MNKRDTMMRELRLRPELQFMFEAVKLGLIEQDLTEQYILPHFNVIGFNLTMVCRPEYVDGCKIRFIERSNNDRQIIEFEEFIKKCPLKLQKHILFNLELFRG